MRAYYVKIMRILASRSQYYGIKRGSLYYSAFSNKLSSDNIYYTKRVSISVMDGSGRAVANKEVSIKSVTEYAQGRYCLLDSTITYRRRHLEPKFR